MITVAFITGSVVSGTIIWQVWRFRESHPKAKPTSYEGTDWYKCLDIPTGLNGFMLL